MHDNVVWASRGSPVEPRNSEKNGDVSGVGMIPLTNQLGSDILSTPV
jgi:hypothetical protein